VKIDGVTIGDSVPPYIIAEMSGNHQGSLSKAKELLEECAKAGVNAFKLQTYSADSLTINSERQEYVVNDGPWNGRTLYDLYSQGQTPRDWVEPLLELGKRIGVSVFSSPFSPSDVDFLETLNVPAFKIASFEITYEQLFRRIAETGKPVIFSTGLAKLSEVAQAVTLLKTLHVENFCILKCTTSYPARLNDLNLNTIKHFAEEYQVPIGFSDHTEGFTASICAVAKGATVIEKHVKLDDDSSSVDSSFSLPVSQLKDFVKACNDAKLANGKIQDGPTDSEHGYLKYRRSIVARHEIPMGQKFTEEDFAIVRPDIGLEPRLLNSLIGKVAKTQIQKGEGIKPHMFD
jgi:pseudaminic acid synthase